MALKINNNSQSLNAHRNLLINDRNVNRTLEKIASGLEIVRASDGPAALVISEQLRSQISGLKQAVRNTEVAVSMVQTTEAALEEVSRLLIDLRQLAVHASNQAANDPLSLEADQHEVNNIIQALNRIATQTSFGSKKLLDGSGSVSGSAVGDDLEFVSGTIETTASTEEGYEVKIIDPASKAFLISDSFIDTDFIVSDETETVTLIENGKVIEHQIRGGDTISDTVSQLNRLAKEEGLDINVSISDDDKLLIQHNQFGSKHSFLAASSTGGFISQEENTPQAAIAGTDVSGSIGGYAAVGDGELLIAKDGTPVEGLTVKYSGIPLDFDEEGVPVGRVFVDQQSLLFQLGADAGDVTNINLAPTFAYNLGRNIDNESNYESIADIDLRNFQGAQDALKLVVAASNDITSLRGRLGALQKNSLEATANYLRNSLENIVASEASIRSADIAEKSADLIRSQIALQSSSLAALHAANSPKVVVSLLRGAQT